MKIISKISVLLLTMIAVISCDKLEELADLDITQGFTTTINVSISEGNPETLNEVATFDLASDDLIKENLDLIKDVNINSLTFKIDNFIGAEGATVSEATMSFGDTTITLNDINLEESDNNSTIYSVGDTTQLNAIADELQEATLITVTLSGTVDSTPANFDIVLTLDTTVTVNVL